MDSPYSAPLREGVGQRPADSVQIPAPDFSSELIPQTAPDIENVIYDGEAGPPDFTLIIERAERERVARLGVVRNILGEILRKKKVFFSPTDPTKADFYIRKGALDYPLGFAEPGPYKIEGAEEWEKYQGRVQAIEDRWAKKEIDELASEPTF